MKKVKIETSQSRLSDKSPRGSISEKTPLMNLSKLTSFPKPQFSTIEEELSHLPYKENEIQLLAKQIGIDFQTEKDKYLWFLIQVANLDLPPGWMREEDPKGGLYYHNPNENITSAKHPMISKFRSLFNEILENEIAGKSKMLALKEKVQKFGEDKDGQASKKMKEPFKLDKAKKFKAAATAIAMTAALSGKINKDDSPLGKFARSVPEPPQSIIDSEKLQDRFNKVKEILEKRRTEQEDKTNEIDNLVRTEEVLNICKIYYIEHYGSEHKDLPPTMLQIEGFDLVDPMDIVEAAKLFNVRSTHAYLFWVLRAYCGLPLPEYWNKTFDTNLHREIYYNSCYDVKISVRPCYFYILELINYLKQEAIRDKDSFLHFSNKMTLSDKLGRQYDVDLASMIKDLTEKATNERKNYFTYHQKKEVAKEEIQKVTKKRKKDDFNPNYSDAHFIEIANQLQVDLNSEIHLLMVIEDFVRSREPVERWFYRQASDGPSFWVNHEQQKAVNRYPYAKELKIIIEEIRKNFKNQAEDAKNHMKAEFNLIKMLFRKYPEDVGRKMLTDEAKNYVEFFLKSKTDGSGSTTNAESKGYNLAGLMRKIGTHLSKHDIMDLLFYCPFDFSQYLGEDFLQSSEQFLMKKLRLKNNNNNQQEGSGDEDFDGAHDGSFESQDSNDSAKKIRLKIEDSKKLLDLAANIKGLNLDPEKKREFMKLLIDFDQKYGDHDLVDALEQDVTESMKDEASTMKNLANALKSKMKEDEEGRGSPESKKNKKTGQDANKNGATASTNAKNKGEKGQKEQEAKGKKGNDTTPSNTGKGKSSNRKDGNVTISKKDGSLGKASKDMKRVIAEGAEEADDSDGSNENQSQTKKRNNNGSSASGIEENEVDFDGARRHAKGKSTKNELNNLEEEGSEEEGSGVQDSDIDIIDTSYPEKDDKAQGGVSPQKASSKFVLDENGKIIFTSKKTQELLENLAEEEKTSTKRRNRGDTKGFSSGQGSVEGEIEGRSSLGQLGLQSQAFDDHEIVYQEIITENGERKLVPINIKTGSRTRGSLSPGKSDNRSKSPTDFEDLKTDSQKIINSSSSKKLLKNSSTKKFAAGQGSRDSLGGDGPLPMIIGSSMKPPGGRSIFGNTESQWDPNILVETLQRYNHDNFDAESKGEKRKEELESALRFSNGEESKIGDSFSRNQLTPNTKRRLAENKQSAETSMQSQTYKSLEPGLHHLDVNYSYKRKNKEKQTKLGLWTHVELFEMEDSSPSQSPDRSMLGHRKSPYDTLKVPGAPRFAEEFHQSTLNNRTFFTPFRKGNMGAKRFIDYLSHLNSLMFIKKLNTLITNFLIKRFAAIQIESLGVVFKPEDPVFRTLFQKRYHKLIKQLRENLLKKKEFINHIYTKVVTNSDNLQDMIFPNLPDIQEAPKHRHTHSNRAQINNQSLAIGKVNENVSPQKIDLTIQSNNKHISVMANKSQPNFKLPQLISHRKPTDKHKTSYRGFKSPSMANPTEESLFDDVKFRTTIGLKDEDVLDSGLETNKKKNNFLPLTTKQNEAEKILKSLNENDQENYKHYWTLLGDPLRVNSFSIFSRPDAALGIQPYHVLLMANRLGLQVQNTEEPDLAWIAYLALTLRLPYNNETNLQITSPKIKNRYQKICNMKYGEHPGDKFFRTVLIYQQMRRKILFEYMSLEEQTQYIKAQSWVKLREENGGVYHYNFSTKQRASTLPGDQKDILSKASALSLKGEIKEKLKLSHQVVQENDHLLTLFKNKLSTQ